MLVKKRLLLSKPDTSINTASLLADFKQRASLITKEEPVLDCFIKFKRLGHFNRAEPKLVVVDPTYTRVVSEHPTHKVATLGYKRNAYGKPFMG